MGSEFIANLTPLAYSKMLLHCAKYPYCAVNGVLLAKSSNNGEVVFVDAVPLFHICLNVTPMYEIAMSQIDMMAQSKGLVIAGYYSAEENASDMGQSDLGQKIASKISEYFHSTFWFMVDNKKFPSIYDGHKNSQIPITAILFSDGKMKRIDRSGLHVSNDAIQSAETLLAEKRDDIFDFDDHLDNLKLDWKNSQINFYLKA